MNIIIITPDIYPYQSGYGGRNPINLFDAFSRMGHKTSLLTSVPDRDLFNSDSNNLSDIYEIVRLHSIEFISTDFDYFSLPYFQDVFKIRKTLLNYHYDIIILNDYFWSLSFISILLMGKRNRSRTVMINHGIISPRGHILKFLFNVFSLIVSRIYIKQFKGILSYSQRSHNAISKIVNPYDRLYIYPLCIDSKQLKKDYKKSLLLSEEYMGKRFGFSGRFIFAIGAASPHKGYENLIRAYSRLKKEFSDMILVIAGKWTPHTDTLKTLAEHLMISSGTKFIGQINEEEKFLLIRKCSIFAIPSLSEGFGGGALEANVIQLKVVATDTGAHREILANNNFAKIVVPGDDNDLYEGMKALLSIKEEPSKTLDIVKLSSYSCESLAAYIISLSK